MLTCCEDESARSKVFWQSRSGKTHCKLRGGGCPLLSDDMACVAAHCAGMTGLIVGHGLRQHVYRCCAGATALAVQLLPAVPEAFVQHSLLCCPLGA